MDKTTGTSHQHGLLAGPVQQDPGDMSAGNDRPPKVHVTTRQIHSNLDQVWPLASTGVFS
jgi:hypothetical protein